MIAVIITGQTQHAMKPTVTHCQTRADGSQANNNNNNNNVTQFLTDFENILCIFNF